MHRVQGGMGLAYDMIGVIAGLLEGFIVEVSPEVCGYASWWSQEHSKNHVPLIPFRNFICCALNLLPPLVVEEFNALDAVRDKWVSSVMFPTAGEVGLLVVLNFYYGRNYRPSSLPLNCANLGEG